ncbi:MAG: hypothetical protein ACOYKZ_05410 [Chlamydiia bacterium]
MPVSPTNVSPSTSRYSPLQEEERREFGFETKTIGAVAGSRDDRTTLFVLNVLQQNAKEKHLRFGSSNTDLFVLPNFKRIQGAIQNQDWGTAKALARKCQVVRDPGFFQLLWLRTFGSIGKRVLSYEQALTQSKGILMGAMHLTWATNHNSFSQNLAKIRGSLNPMKGNQLKMDLAQAQIPFLRAQLDEIIQLLDGKVSAITIKDLRDARNILDSIMVGHTVLEWGLTLLQGLLHAVSRDPLVAEADALTQHGYVIQQLKV